MNPNDPLDKNSDASLDTQAPIPLEMPDGAESLNEYDAADQELSKQFQEGEELRFVRVRFPGNNRVFAFHIGKADYRYGQQVVALSDRGIGVGFVNSFPYTQSFHKGLLPVRSIIRIATSDDTKIDLTTFKQEKRLKEIVERLIEKNQLDMQITQVELTQLGKKAIFYFTAPSRVDFRGLVHEIVGELKMRIELRQISVRDRAASQGGLGPCGRELCCSSFLAKYGNVGIKLAKNQDLSLNSSKINGVCGQLKCCLTYEDEVYQEKRKKLPRENALVKTKDGHRGKVVRLHILSEQFETISAEGIIRRYVAEMFDGPAEGLEVPKYFENGIADHTKNIIGLEQAGQERHQQLEQELQSIKASAKDYAQKTFEQLFGANTLDWSLPEVAEPSSSNPKKVIPPDEEEEIIYVAPEDDILLDETDEDGDEETEEDTVEEPVLNPTPPTTKITPPTRSNPQESANRSQAAPSSGGDNQRRNQHRHRRHRGNRAGHSQGGGGGRLPPKNS